MMAARSGWPLRLYIGLLAVLLLLAGAAMARIGYHWMMLPVVMLVLAAAWYLTHGLTRPLMLLAQEAEAIRSFDFHDRPVVTTHVREVVELAHSVDLMRDTLRRFLDLNLALAGEDDFNKLLPRLLSDMALAAGAETGVLYLAGTQGDTLLSAAMRIGDGEHQGTLPPALPFTRMPAILRQAVAAADALEGQVTQAELESVGLDATWSRMRALALPLLNRREHLVGAILLFSDHALESTRQRFVAALSASAAQTLETRELLRDQKQLFEALIRMVAGAIDAQSPYTGGHCERVPELTQMLARAACDATDGPYAGFQLDADEWEAVHIASWLHDCGKVTTPEFVVDKATKLETVYDRIHEVRMRFEVLKRDAEVAYWRGIAAGGDASVLEATRNREWARLDEEFAFVARCNLGGEFLASEHQARLREIGMRCWQRTLDDSLGISRDEQSRQDRTKKRELPALEPLLADKPEHRIPRPQGQGIEPDNPWGFRMPSPALLYDRGELHNLTVSRGTLSEEERYKINEHIVQTITMLSSLPFPKHLQSVPEIAGGHHEKMDGTGYPKGLMREQMSPVARMMAIADIFEALTAADRPYKSAKTLPQALVIMAKMRDDEHIDAELFELFLRSGVYHDYALRHLRSEQMEAVDIEGYLSSM